MALTVYRLQIARMVDLGRCPAALPRLGLADDVVNLVGRCEPQPSTQAVGTLAQPAITLQDDQPQLFPSIPVAALVSITTFGRRPASLGGGLGWE